MAEFMEVMKAARRMCESIDDCANCPLLDASTELCYLDKCPKEYNDSDFIQHEAAIMKWSAEHPELRYPTWREWHQSNFPDAYEYISPCAFMDRDNKCRNDCLECREHPIPADIAQKLGIKPIPVEPQETLVDEYERLRNRAENLNLYLRHVQKNYPAVFDALGKKFSGLPGFEMVEG